MLAWFITHLEFHHGQNISPTWLGAVFDLIHPFMDEKQPQPMRLALFQAGLEVGRIYLTRLERLSVVFQHNDQSVWKNRAVW